MNYDAYGNPIKPKSSGVLVPRLQWADVEDLISTALDAAHRRLQQHEVYADVADKLPLVNVDFVTVSPLNEVALGTPAPPTLPLMPESLMFRKVELLTASPPLTAWP